jgi:hypothetical protein
VLGWLSNPRLSREPILLVAAPMNSVRDDIQGSDEAFHNTTRLAMIFAATALPSAAGDMLPCVVARWHVQWLDSVVNYVEGIGGGRSPQLSHWVARKR